MKANPAIGGRGGSSGFESIYTYFYGLGSGLGNCSIPNIVEARKNAQVNACKANLRTLEFAIQQWALKKASATIPR